MIKVVSVSVPRHAILSLVFSDRKMGDFDMSELLAREGAMVLPLRDPAFFARVFLELGAPTWPNGFDLAPWGLHRALSEAGVLRSVDQAA